MTTFTLKSPAFEHHCHLPPRYAKQNENLSPPLLIEGIPVGTKSLALIVDDPDAPVAVFTHWVVYNIPPVHVIEEGKLPKEAKVGVNSWGDSAYGGPRPPSGTHRYFFKLFALDVLLPEKDNMTKELLEKEMKRHLLSEATLIGLYDASSPSH